MQADLEALCREATQCRCCFEGTELRQPVIDLAQPRFVGPGYWKAKCRVLIVTLNPGGGESRTDSADGRFRQLIRSFRDGKGTLQAVFDHQAMDMAYWGRGRFLSFYTRGLNLKLNSIAFGNIAWCATRGNKYPGYMLNACFMSFTSRLLSELEPHVVLLSGSPSHRYTARVQAILPSVRVIPMMHYAHREGAVAERNELARVGALIREAVQT